MLICDITQAYTATSGGVRTYLFEKRKYIEQYTSWEHLLIVPGEEDRIERDGRFITATVAGPPIPGCAPYRFFHRFDKVLSLLRRYRPDMIELGSGYAIPWTLFAYRNEFRCGMAGFYHTDFPDAYVAPFVQRFAGKRVSRIMTDASRLYAWQIYRRCDVTFTSSPMFLTKLEDMGIKNAQYVPLGVDLQLFHPQKRSPILRERLRVRSDQILLVYAGRLDREKRVDMLLEAFSRLPHDLACALVLVGEGPYREMVAARAVEDSRIHLLPFTADRSMLAELLASADIYVSAGPFETFGLSVLEAQASGLAVAGVRSGALIERVPEQLGLLGEPDSSNALAQTIYELATNGFRQKGQNARSWVASSFSWSNTFVKIFSVYTAIIESNHAP